MEMSGEVYKCTFSEEFSMPHVFQDEHASARRERHWLGDIKGRRDAVWRRISWFSAELRRGKNSGPNSYPPAGGKNSLGTDSDMLSVPVAYIVGYLSSRKYLYTVGLLNPHTLASSLTFSLPATNSG